MQRNNIIQLPEVTELYPAYSSATQGGEEAKAAFLRGEPFVNAETLSRCSVYNFAPGDAIRIKYLRMEGVDALELHAGKRMLLDLTFSITFTIPKE